MNPDCPAGSIRCVAITKLPTKWGHFCALGFERSIHNKVQTALVLIMGDVMSRTPLVRIHSECFTGDVFGSQHCECGDRLNGAMRAIAKEGAGIVIYERQDECGIGLTVKRKAYQWPDQKSYAVDANDRFGFEADARDYWLSVGILRFLGIGHVRLLTNNTLKVAALERAGIEVAERLNCEIRPSASSLRYLLTRKTNMGHEAHFSSCSQLVASGQSERKTPSL